MKRTNLHLNLLRDEEKFSSSPVRLRVMLPVLGLLLCVAMGLWWMGLFFELQTVRSRLSSTRTNLEDTKSDHAGAIDDLKSIHELQGELDQLVFYVNGRRTWGKFLAKLPEVVPPHVQLTTLTIPEAQPQLLKNPLNPKAPPLLGPTNDTELVSLRLTGRTPRSEPVSEFMEQLADKSFSEWLEIGGTGKGQSPRVHSFSQELSANAGEGRLLTFDVEYRAVARRFAK